VKRRGGHDIGHEARQTRAAPRGSSSPRLLGAALPVFNARTARTQPHLSMRAFVDEGEARRSLASSPRTRQGGLTSHLYRAPPLVSEISSATMKALYLLGARMRLEPLRSRRIAARGDHRLAPISENRRQPMLRKTLLSPYQATAHRLRFSLRDGDGEGPSSRMR